ncbi:light-regulated signal transduction histidine kinase (bacteriophytochrome) [Endobacter medicaginis]|uniref:Light-regulated signal transduction histidine kinase (Bacteriophytochrome) n=2 Tax=Endobacter medicaginis TaxID=1181271 RepID=A0A839UVP9_9PROT|nr:histidine kinase dimerization/phosphoacceptor domain -containing protein [Endobacter medicaginis]MBB3172725.1 light-regulated signal transduction histidine kinase (bacteriophytochrome) [Endobacter medicaginis]MCX5474332.1 GAF domain-containing protein [Endobacter medicaginis]
MTLITDPPVLNLTECDREPIHRPGAIQPHGLLLVADRLSLVVVACAGEVEARLTDPVLGRPVSELLGIQAAHHLARHFADEAPTVPDPLVVLDGTIAGRSETFVAVAHRKGEQILIELEPMDEDPRGAMQLLAELESLGRWFEAAPQIASLCERGATAFGSITGFDRVLIYRFLDDGTGRVVAETRSDALDSFLNHHFPAADIPQQARALYLRSLARAIPDVGYTPAPIRPESFAGLDLSDTGLRSVSPVHLQYMRHMEVGASASFSIVCEDRLWGLVACHHAIPRRLSRETVLRGVALAGVLGRQIRAREQSGAYDERLRLREAVEELATHFDTDKSSAALFGGIGDILALTFGAHGFIHVMGDDATAWGITPTGADLEGLVAWARDSAIASLTAQTQVLQTQCLSALYAPALAWPDRASGLLCLRMPNPHELLIWTRVEQREEIAWAGNPHTADKSDDDRSLTPRASFATWVESVRGRSAAWTQEEVDAARHFQRLLAKAQDDRAAARLNRELQRTLGERDALLRQKDLLMREIDHRMLNSLQLVGSYLALQAREAGPGSVSDHLVQAQARLAAIGLVHRQLFRREQTDTVDLRVYLGELMRDLGQALGGEWAPHLRSILTPILMTGDRAMHVGIVLVELVINASKYAYGGAPGPIAVTLGRQGGQVRLTVADQGVGRDIAGIEAGGGATGKGTGFGSLMVRATVARLGGTLTDDALRRGLSLTLVAPITAPEP